MILLLDLFLVIGIIYGKRLDSIKKANQVQRIHVHSKDIDGESQGTNVTQQQMFTADDITNRPMNNSEARTKQNVGYCTVFGYTHRVTNIFMADKDYVSRPARVISFIASAFAFL